MLMKKFVAIIALSAILAGCGLIGATKTIRSYSALMKAEKFLFNRQYMDARRAAHDALTMAQDHWGKGHPETAVFLSGLGHIYGKMGDYVMADAFFKDAKGVNRPGRKEYRRNKGFILQAHGRILSDEGKLSRALTSLRRAGRILADLPAGHLKAAYNNSLIAEVLCRKGDREKAEKVFRRSLGVYSRSIQREEHSGNAFHAYAGKGRYPDFLRAVSAKNRKAGQGIPAVPGSPENPAQNPGLQRE